MRHVLKGIVLAVAASATLLYTSDASADPRIRGGLIIGGGGVRIGIGNGPMYGPGYGWGPRYGYGYGYGPPPVVVRPYPVYQPAPVVVPQPVYVQPQPQYLPPRTIIRESDIPSGPSPLADGGEILLFSPSTNASDVRYTLNGALYTMPPGTKQKFTNDRTWMIEYESAPGQVTKYTLASGRYKFKPTAVGIGLYLTQDLPDTAQPTLPQAPVPSPPEPSASGSETIVPPRVPALKTTP